MRAHPTPHHKNLIPADAEGIGRAAATLRRGGLVAFPTETVYGLGANALDERAVAGIFEAKGRPSFDPLIVHLAEPAEAWRLAGKVPEPARQLAQAFWPGPLTLVLHRNPPQQAQIEPLAPAPDDRQAVPDIVTAGLGTLALRVPGHPLARELITAAGLPVAAPSANRFGGVSPTRAEHVAEELGDAVSLILDGGRCRTGVESTVVSFTANQPAVLRLGGLAVEQIEQVLGPVAVAGSTSRPGDGAAGAGEHQGPEPVTWTSAGDSPGPASPAPEAPGMLERHYAPGTPLQMVERLTPEMLAEIGGRVGVLLFTGHSEPIDPAPRQDAVVETLSPAGDLREAAANLFAAMRRLDQAGLDRILAERAPEQGLGRAINDRLQRAAASGPGG
jgi:L-threonylcarbamoyladenylate synthase